MFRLALALGMTVRELKSRLTYNEFTEWMAYYQLEPFGEFRSDLRNGALCSLIANIKRDPKRRSSPYEPKDFMPFLDDPELEDEGDGDQLDRLFRNLGFKVEEQE